MPLENSFITLKNKHILITGASSGLGKACAILCSQLEATVTLFGRNKDRLDETLSALENKQNHHCVSLDLNETEQVKKEISEAVKRSGKISGLAHCAGISMILPLNAVSEEKMATAINTNVIATYQLTKEVVKSKHFSKEGGSVVLVASVMGSRGEAGRSLYSLTKGALIATTKSLAVELARKRIRVNSVSPGVVKTPMSQKSAYQQDPNALEAVIARHPLGLGVPQDVAYPIMFLLSDASSWITGIDLPVDGGYMAT